METKVFKATITSITPDKVEVKEQNGKFTAEVENIEKYEDINGKITYFAQIPECWFRIELNQSCQVTEPINNKVRIIEIG